MNENLAKALRIFFHYRSPAAVYRHPRRLLNNVAARSFNFYLNQVNAIKPGSKVTCNICGFRGHRFGYMAAVSTEYFAANEICLNCRSNGRTRALIELFNRTVNLNGTHLVVADIGAARSTRIFFEHYPNVTYLVIDRYKSADVHSDITDIGLPGNSVEGILCCHVLEHIDDYRKGMEEMFRILKAGHKGVVAVPQKPGLYKSRRTAESTFQGYGHVWEFGDDFADLLRGVGFQVSTFNMPKSKNGDRVGTLPYHVVQKPDQ